METVRRKIINKKQFSLYKLSSTTKWMNALENFYTDQDQSFVEDNAGRRTFLTFFKEDRILDLMIINSENTASHKNRVQKSYEFMNGWIISG